MTTNIIANATIWKYRVLLSTLQGNQADWQLKMDVLMKEEMDVKVKLMCF